MKHNMLAEEAIRLAELSVQIKNHLPKTKHRDGKLTITFSSEEEISEVIFHLQARASTLWDEAKAEFLQLQETEKIKWGV